MAIDIDSSIDTIRSTINGIELVSMTINEYNTANGAFAEANAFQSVINTSYATANVAFSAYSQANVVITAYSNANAALAEANAFQSVINSAFATANVAFSAYAQANVVITAYSNANAALAEANAFQSIINSAYSTANVVSSVYASYNAFTVIANQSFVNITGNGMTGALTTTNFTSNIGINTGVIFANSIVTATGNITGQNFNSAGVVNTQSVMVKSINVGGTYVLGQNDSGTVIFFNNTNAFTVNTSAANTGAGAGGAGFQGFRVVLTQVNTGQVTVVQGPNTLLAPRITGNNSTSGQNASLSLVCFSANTFLLDGSLVGGTIPPGQIIDNLTTYQGNQALSANMGAYITQWNHGSVNLTIGATGVTQGTAQKLNCQFNIVTVCTAGANSVILPVPPTGTEITVVNQGATGVNIYPPVGHGIDTNGLNANTNARVNGFRRFVLANTNHWYTSGNGVYTTP